MLSSQPSTPRTRDRPSDMSAVTQPEWVAATWTLPDPRAALARADGWRRVLLLAALRIKLNRFHLPTPLT